MIKKLINEGLDTIGPYNEDLLNHLQALFDAMKDQDTLDVPDAPAMVKRIQKQAAERMSLDPNFFHYASLCNTSMMFPDIKVSMNKTEMLPLTLFLCVTLHSFLVFLSQYVPHVPCPALQSLTPCATGSSGPPSGPVSRRHSTRWPTGTSG